MINITIEKKGILIMKEIKVGHYKNDNNSRFVYLGEAIVKTIEMQRTETRMIGLLDIVFEVPLEFGESCEFLIRLETQFEDIRQFLDKLASAFQNPVHHPNPDDLFRVEWAYLQLLNRDLRASPRLLEQRLADDADFFCEVIHR